MISSEEARDALAMTLGEIQCSIDSSLYPETDAYIGVWFGTKEPTLSLAEISNALLNCDKTEILPPAVVDFILPNYEAAADAGDPDAMFSLGELFFTGRCGTQSYEKAIAWYTKAHEEGSPRSTEKLANCYYYGYGVQPDYEKAYRMFSKCALLGWTNSLYMIGDMYRYGLYVECDPYEAFRMYEEAYKAIDEKEESILEADVLRRLADCYHEGIGTKQDDLTALSLYQSAERHYYLKMKEHATFELGELESVLEAQENCRKRIVEKYRKEFLE